ncbi:hypothetical protein GPECTOR_10g934 [Gonium pectorale]|uniref:Uncharacterized protein n=1 Tax=Gonium pectorale TaxID=33097 RepID=A0A150GRC4_GONPE|nr:hypothetical protein GPECTOR_10g934 [Gonium pectorale]|eukprot:KXZ52302.1 hypothetical protein GPECTOR_10g934 [Gonium pectorale]
MCGDHQTEKIRGGSVTAYQAVVPYAYMGFKYGALFGIATACVTKTRVDCIYSTLGRAASASGLAGAVMGGAYGTSLRAIEADVEKDMDEAAKRHTRHVFTVRQSLYAMLSGTLGAMWWLVDRLPKAPTSGPTLFQSIAATAAVGAVVTFLESQRQKQMVIKGEGAGGGDSGSSVAANGEAAGDKSDE